MLDVLKVSRNIYVGQNVIELQQQPLRLETWLWAINNEIIHFSNLVRYCFVTFTIFSTWKSKFGLIQSRGHCAAITDFTQRNAETSRIPHSNLSDIGECERTHEIAVWRMNARLTVDWRAM